MSKDELYDHINNRIDTATKRASYAMFLRYMGYPEEKVLALKRPDKVTREIKSKVLSVPEVNRLMKESDEETRLILSFLYDTACRRKELLDIHYGDISFRDTNTAKKIWADVHIVAGKGGKSRIVYLKKDTTMLLRKLRPQMNPKQKVFVFYKPDGKTPYVNQAHQLYLAVKDAGEKILNRHVHPHCWRHTRLTHLANQGADVLGISRYAGHKDIKTSQIYIDYSTYISEKTFEQYS